MKRKNRALFVTFEGGEGAGKTTLINRVYETLSSKGHTVIKTFEPGDTPLGEEIRKLVLLQEERPVCKQSELFLFLTDRAQHVQEVIVPALEEGKIVLCDRFNDSTMAYQGVARALDPDLLEKICLTATDGLVPDLTLYLDLDPKEGLKRAQHKEAHDRIEKEKGDFHSKVRAAFLSFAEKEPDRFHVIDASQPIDTVYQNAMSEVELALCHI
ncbi:dTMP kinase [Candidatus Neptunochlamydia vexilliferae]|uniref:dTMP kinase n=1 Tax=Candidatus Neptunichlamydia vexilliferae TaxID=1651774 RepID=UPI001890DC4F|nr:dTMP kinase [Candidatus Neptunochlamydia vexilliferae]